jgi:hypothetical protein
MGGGGFAGLFSFSELTASRENAIASIERGEMINEVLERQVKFSN